MRAINIAASAAAICAVIAGCGGTSPRAAAAVPGGPACSRADAVTASVSRVAAYFDGVTTQAEVIGADDNVAADPRVTGSEASDLADITAAEAGSPASLAGPLARLAADYTALETGITANGDPAAVSADAAATMADARQVDAACG